MATVAVELAPAALAEQLGKAAEPVAQTVVQGVASLVAGVREAAAMEVVGWEGAGSELVGWAEVGTEGVAGG